MSLSSNRLREWRLRRGLTLQQLAEGCGTTKSQIDKLEKGERRLTVDWMVRIAKPLGCEPKELLPETPSLSPFQSASAFSGLAQTLPVRGAARGGKPQEMFLTDGPIDQVPCPAALAHTKDAYAMYVVGESMVPMYRPRQLLYINPYKPPVAGGGVIVVLKNNAVLIKEFVAQKSNTVTLREYRPAPRSFSVPLSDIQALHAVVGAMEPI